MKNHILQSVVELVVQNNFLGNFLAGLKYMARAKGRVNCALVVGSLVPGPCEQGLVTPWYTFERRVSV